MEYNFDQVLEDLKKLIKNRRLDVKPFEEAEKSYHELGEQLEKIFDYARKNAEGKEKEGIEKLYKRLVLDNTGETFEKLRSIGHRLSKSEDSVDKNCVKALQSQAYRIMEKTRHGLRDEVYYMISRIFVVNNREIPLLLARAFNPVYPDDIFKIFIYSFLSGIIGEKEKKEGGQNE